MTLTVHTLDLGRAATDSSFFVKHSAPGTLVSAPMYGYLILGGEAPIVVDTGFRNDDVMARIGFVPDLRAEHSIEAQLDRHGVAIDEVGAVIQTHLHVDHAGQIEKFPTTTPIVINRTEMEFAAGGLQGLGYAPEDMKHLIDRTHAPGAIRWLDLELSGPVSVAPGVRCEYVGGHTEGSIVVYVDTADGQAAICGDIVYDIKDQVFEGLMQSGYLEPQITNNTMVSTRQEIAAIKRVLDGADYLLPGHDRAAKVECGRVVGRVVGPTVPGPLEPAGAPSALVAVEPAGSPGVSFYFLAALNRHDRERFAEYQRGAQQAAYAAAPDLAFLASAEDITVEEGELDANVLVLVRFADEAEYRAWWDSEQYQAVIPAREASADTRLVVTFPGRE